MYALFKDLARAVADFAREEVVRRQQRLNSFLPMPERLIRIMESLIQAHELTDVDVLGNLNAANQFLEGFAKAHACGGYAEQRESLGKWLRLQRVVLQKAQACLNEGPEGYLSAEIQRELRRLQKQMHDIGRFLQKRMASCT